MEQRQATYTSATRMADMVLMLTRSWAPMPLDKLCEDLGVSPRTAKRYRSALNTYFREKFCENDKSLKFIQSNTESGRELWFLSQQQELEADSFKRLISVYVSMVLLKTLDSSVLEEGINELWQASAGQVEPSKKGKLTLFARKFRCTGFGRKSYTRNDAVLKQVINALIGQKKLQVLHSGAAERKPRYHIIHPYTLLLHRDSLYLHAYAETRKGIRTFSIDKIEEATVFDAQFRYPPEYDPDRLTQGSFGIFEEPDGKLFNVVVSFQEILHDYITTRQWHPRQRFSSLKNGRFTMQVPLTNVHEFIPWVLQFGGDAEVLEPASVRSLVKKALTESLAHYE